MEDSKYTLKLVDPCMEYFDSFLEALDEGFPYYWGDRSAPYPPEMIKEIKDNPEAYIKKQNTYYPNEYETTTGKKFIYATKRFWVIHIESNEYVGEITLSPENPPDFFAYAGTTGFAIRPLQRNKGYGAQSVALLKEYTREKHPNLPALVMTCSLTNKSSEKAIIKAGGIYSETIDPGFGMEVSKHFRIEL